MFDHLSKKERNQHVEVCRYFFRCNVMKNNLEALVAMHGGIDKAVTTEWDEFWTYYSFWLSGLWVACEGIERIKFGDVDFITFVKTSMSLLHPIRQATFHFRPNTSQMSRHFDSGAEWIKLRDIHNRIANMVGAFLASLPPEYLDSMDGD